MPVLNPRKIHTAVPSISGNHIRIDSRKTVQVYFEVVLTTNKSEFQFARRPFVGAKRVIFDENGYHSYVSSECVNGNYIEICKKGAHRILGVGKKTKRFSIWFKIL